MTHRNHLGDRLSALVDGELDHDARERALVHLAHCSSCRAEADAQRAVKRLLAGTPVPDQPAGAAARLLALAEPGGPLPPRARTMPQGPVVPDVSPPGRRPPGGRARPAGRHDGRHPGGRSAVRRRLRLVAAGALSVAGLVLGTAFAVGGTPTSEQPVVPPVAELSVEHTRTSTAVTVGDPGTGLMVGFEDVDAARGDAAPGR